MALEWYPWFQPFWEDIIQILREQRASLVRAKWEIGKRILDFMQVLRENKVLTKAAEAPTVHGLLKLLAKKIAAFLPSTRRIISQGSIRNGATLRRGNMIGRCERSRWVATSITPLEEPELN